MALELPNLDDRTYTDLVEEGRSMIPHYAPSWTNHNPSDPGITVIELLAYFSELLNFRLNRVTRESKLQFLRLLQGADNNVDDKLADASGEKIDEALRAAVAELGRVERAVTKADFEHLAKVSGPGVSRAHCEPRTDLEAQKEAMRHNRRGHVSVVIVPAESKESPSDDIAPLLEQVGNFLRPKCLLTTRLHVVGPRFLWVDLEIKVRPKPGVPFKHVVTGAQDALDEHFSPFPEKRPTGEGWPFGRSLHISEVYDVVDRVNGVDYVESVYVLHLSDRGTSDFGNETAVGIQTGIVSQVGVDTRFGAGMHAGRERLIKNGAGRLSSIALASYELLRVVAHVEEASSGVS